MPSSPIVVLADDLTGACEIAAIGMRYGLRSAVSIDLQHDCEDVDLLVIDTETRLDSPAFAAARLQGCLAEIEHAAQQGRLFKKTDSTLRGPIAAEVTLLAGKLGYERVLLAAGNPQLGRTINKGYYRIYGKPLHETDFARDLHHPAHSAWIIDLLGATTSMRIHRCSKDEAIPKEGIVAVDVSSTEDFTFWSHHVSEQTLPAGSAAFFEAILKMWRPTASQINPVLPDDIPERPLMLLSGTTASTQIQGLRQLRDQSASAIGLRVDDFASTTIALHASIAATLRQCGRVLLFMDDASDAKPENATLVRSGLGKLAQECLNHEAIRHLVVEGGATAASVALGLHWKILRARYEWAPGIVTLQPDGSEHACFFTMKPGSYPWPTNIRPLLFGAQS
jgi:uncharacterized protein YgbK (DUF1537 family)